jgi:hypothetical protein
VTSVFHQGVNKPLRGSKAGRQGSIRKESRHCEGIKEPPSSGFYKIGGIGTSTPTSPMNSLHRISHLASIQGDHVQQGGTRGEGPTNLS